jgi:NAD(P)-dependent dehydrogenase (short-subunit alcohol dehydrogenase family)
MNRLKGKRALITAATRELGPDALIIASDASDAAAQKQVADAVGKAFGGLDVLFVNAGIVDMRPIEQFDPDAFDRSFAINLKGPIF